MAADPIDDGESMFAGLADFVARRHKMIIIAWIVALLVALPLAPLVSSVVQYEETENAPASLESTGANDYIAEQFGGTSEQPTTLIVLTASDVRSEEVKQAVSRIESDLNNASMDGNIHKVTVDTIYGVAEIYTLNVLIGLNSAYTGANLTAYVIYGLPQDYRALWQETGQSAHAFYDVPAYYADIWSDINETVPPGTPVAVVDGMTYSAVNDLLNASSGGLPPEKKALRYGWFNAFATAWNGTAAPPATAGQRAEIAHGAAFGPFLEALPATVEEKVFLALVNETFADQEISFANVSALSHQLFEGNLDVMMTNGTEEQERLVHEYFNATYAWWSLLGSEPDQGVFEAGVATVAAAFGQNITDPTTRSMFTGLHQALGFAKFNDLAVRKATISALIASMPSVAQQLAPRPWVVAAAGDLGTSYSTSKVVALSRQIVANSSLADFPVTIPEDIVAMLVSPSNSTMLMALTYDPLLDNAEAGKGDVNKVRAIVASAVHGTGIKAYVTGSDPINVDLQNATTRDMEIIEPITIILVLVLIGLFFRSFVASSIPPISIGVALGITYSLVYLIGTYVMSIHYSVLTLLLTSMMGAGCDYCIFILSRYREERHNGRDKEEAVKQAVTWAGESIATSGATVIIGFGVLAIGRFAMMQSMGVALAIGVTIALLVALTLLPSLLLLLGDKMFWPAKMNRPAKVRSGPGYFTRSAKFSIKHAKVILVAAVVISVPATYVVYTMQTSYDFIGSMAESESKDGLAALQDGFGGGKITPTQVALQMNSQVMVGDVFNPVEVPSIENISAKIAALNNVKQVTSPTRPYGAPIDYNNATAVAQYRSTIQQMIGHDGKSVLLTITFQAEPFNKDSIASIQDLRDVAVEAQSDPHIVMMFVGGATASMFDIANMVQSDISGMEVLVVIGIYIVLLVALGSVINPLKSILTILLSISWTLAVTLILFQVVLGQPVLYMVPLILLIVCLGLGMDYDILLITRIREEVTKGRENNEAIVIAVEKTGAIITACGLIMAAAFGSMMLSNGFLLKQFGFALMFAILLDAIIVRIYLVPAIMSLLGKWNWWAPGPLQRINAKHEANRSEELKPAEGSLHHEEAKGPVGP